MTDQIRTLTVKGTGKESFSPDRITVSVTVETAETEYSKTTGIQAEKTAEITSALIKAGFDKTDLTTSDYNINTEYENYQKNGIWKRKFKEYHCTQHMNLSFEQSSEKLNKVINALSSCKNSAPRYNISFTVKDKDKVSDKLLTLAVEDAKRKAQVLAAAAGVKLAEIQSIDYNPVEISIYSPTRVMSAAPMMREAADFDTAETEINPEKIEACAAVTVVWEIG